MGKDRPRSNPPFFVDTTTQRLQVLYHCSRGIIISAQEAVPNHLSSAQHTNPLATSIRWWFTNQIAQYRYYQLPDFTMSAVANHPAGWT